MSEEVQEKDNGSQPTENVTPKEGKQEATPPKTPEEVTQEEIDAINKEIEEANKKLISEDVSELIKKEKELAKKEAEKEFLVNQRVKELEAELKRKDEERIASERASASQLQAIMEKVNALTASKAPVHNDNPFANEPSAPPQSKELDEDTASEIERASYIAFMESASRYGQEVNKA